MSPVRIVILAVAAIAAIALAIVLRNYTSKPKASPSAAAAPAKPMARVLAAAAEGRSAPAKVIVTRAAASDEPLGPFSAAALVTLLFTHLDIQGH